MSLASMVAEALGEGQLLELAPASIVVAVVVESASSFYVRVTAPGFFWRTDRLTKESTARKVEEAARRYIAKTAQLRADEGGDWRWWAAAPQLKRGSRS